MGHIGAAIAFMICGAIAIFWIRERHGGARRAPGFVAFAFFNALFIVMISEPSAQSTAAAHHWPCTHRGSGWSLTTHIRPGDCGSGA